MAARTHLCCLLLQLQLGVFILSAEHLQLRLLLLHLLTQNTALCLPLCGAGVQALGFPLFLLQLQGQGAVSSWETWDTPPPCSPAQWLTLHWLLWS